MNPLLPLLLTVAIACPPNCPCGCQAPEAVPQYDYYGRPIRRDYPYQQRAAVREYITPNSAYYPEVERRRPFSTGVVPYSPGTPAN